MEWILPRLSKRLQPHGFVTCGIKESIENLCQNILRAFSHSKKKNFFLNYKVNQLNQPREQGFSQGFCKVRCSLWLGGCCTVTQQGRGCWWGDPAPVIPSLLSSTPLPCESRPEPPAASAVLLQSHVKNPNTTEQKGKVTEVTLSILL